MPGVLTPPRGTAFGFRGNTYFQLGLGSHSDRASITYQDYPNPHPEFKALEWAYPESWPPQQAIVALALKHYGFPEMARKVNRRYIENVVTTWEKTGTTWERYNAAQGGYWRPVERTEVAAVVAAADDDDHDLDGGAKGEQASRHDLKPDYLHFSLAISGGLRPWHRLIAGQPGRTACRLRFESGQVNLTQRPLHGAEHLIELR
jgi:hypothetical protein